MTQEFDDDERKPKYTHIRVICPKCSIARLLEFPEPEGILLEVPNFVCLDCYSKCHVALSDATGDATHFP